MPVLRGSIKCVCVVVGTHWTTHLDVSHSRKDTCMLVFSPQQSRFSRQKNANNKKVKKEEEKMEQGQCKLV